MRLKLLLLSCAVLALSFHPGSAFGDTIKTLRFNEIPQTAIPPPLHVFGITFNFMEDSTIGTGGTADYGAPFTGATANPKLGPTVLLGNVPGILTLTFDTPTTMLSFEEASAVTTSNVFEVRLFNASNFSLGTTDVVTNPAPCSPPTPTCSNLSQGSSSYNNSSAAIKTAVLDFSSSVPGITPSAFAIDSLTYVMPSVAVPEPSPSWLFLCGLGLFGAYKSYRLTRK